MVTHRQMTFLEKQDYVQRLAEGGLRYETAKALGLVAEQVRVALRDDPDFRAACQDAVLAANEPVETALYTAAKAGEPWAVQFYLKNRDRERWGEKTEVKVTHELDGTKLIESVQDIVTQLKRRREIAEGKIIDAVVVDQSNNPMRFFPPGQSPKFLPASLAHHRKDKYGVRKPTPKEPDV